MLARDPLATLEGGPFCPGGGCGKGFRKGGPKGGLPAWRMDDQWVLPWDPGPGPTLAGSQAVCPPACLGYTRASALTLRLVGVGSPGVRREGSLALGELIPAGFLRSLGPAA